MRLEAVLQHEYWSRRDFFLVSEMMHSNVDTVTHLPTDRHYDLATVDRNITQKVFALREITAMSERAKWEDGRDHAMDQAPFAQGWC